MSLAIEKSDLRDIYEKVAADERITDAEAVRLFESKDLNAGSEPSRTSSGNGVAEKTRVTS